MDELIIKESPDGSVSLSNGVRNMGGLSPKEIGFSWKISNNTGKPEFDVRYRGKVMFVVDDDLLLSRFNGRYKNVNDEFERSKESLLEALKPKKHA